MTTLMGISDMLMTMITLMTCFRAFESSRGNSKYHYYGIRVKPDSPLNRLQEDTQYMAMRQQPVHQKQRSPFLALYLPLFHPSLSPKSSSFNNVRFIFFLWMYLIFVQCFRHLKLEMFIDLSLLTCLFLSCPWWNAMRKPSTVMSVLYLLIYFTFNRYPACVGSNLCRRSTECLTTCASTRTATTLQNSLLQLRANTISSTSVSTWGDVNLILFGICRRTYISIQYLAYLQSLISVCERKECRPLNICAPSCRHSPQLARVSRSRGGHSASARAHQYERHQEASDPLQRPLRGRWWPYTQSAVLHDIPPPFT